MRDILLYIGSAAFLLGGCAKDSILFPEQVEVEEETAEERGPVKQTQFDVVAGVGGTARFVLNDIDTEKITSIFFSHNPAGEQEDTELTHFENDYVIENLPIETRTDIEVWAKGTNNLLSKKTVYSVFPPPHAATFISRAVTIDKELVKIARINVTNETDLQATFYYKTDLDAEFNELLVEARGQEIITLDVPLGTSSITYYVIDDGGGESDEVTAPFVVSDELIAFTTAELKADWEVSVSSNQPNDGQGGPALIDGDEETFWHTPHESGVDGDFPHSATITFDEDILLSQLILQMRHNNGTGAPHEMDLQVSMDGVNFETHQSFVNTSTVARSVVTFDLDELVAARYVRVVFNSGYSGERHMALGEISFAGYR